MSDWDQSYMGTPPWDIGRPQPEFLRLLDEGELKGEVLDVGCGTGEHSLMLASRGLRVVGVDFSRIAIAKAQAKAKEKGLSAEFLVHDALDLPALGRRFDTVIDCGLFHVFPDAERAAYVRSLSGVVKPGGSYFMLCFSDREPKDWGGPRRVTRDEILESFSEGWEVISILPSRFETNRHGPGGKAWLASIARRH